MKTKIIPFDLETAFEIQKGKTKGKIVRKGAQNQVCEILEFAAEYQDKCSEKFLIVKVPAHDLEKEKLWVYHQDGKAMHSSNYEEMWYDLVLEVPDNEPQFKPFDKVLVRGGDDFTWKCGIFSHIEDLKDRKFVVNSGYWKQCIPYEGNEHLVGTTNKPNED